MTFIDSSDRVVIADLAKKVAENCVDAQPNVLMHIRNLWEFGYRDTSGKMQQIIPHHPFNGITPTSAGEIGLDWYLSKEDAANVRLILDSERVIDERINRAGKTMRVVFSAPPNLYSIAIDGSAVFDVQGYSQYLAEKQVRNAKGQYTVREAAQVLAEAHGFDAATFIKKRMLPAHAAGLLSVLDPKDWGQVKGRPAQDYSDVVTPASIDEWLERDGFAAHVRWPVRQPQQTETEYIMEPEAMQPDPLPTKAIGELFDGIEFTQHRWIKNIGTAAWLEDANMGKGERGGASATWCPLTVARLVYARQKDASMTEAKSKRKTLDALNSRFRTNPVLKPWKDAWDDYYSIFTDTGEA